jgi:nitroreductase
MTRLKALMRERVSAAPTGEETEYDIYPKGLPSPYKDRRQEIGELLYGQLKIPREDKLGRALWFARNFEFFGAPIGLFCSVDRLMGPPQWADLGMILQNVMLLLRAEGLDSCPQECWAIYPKTMGTFLCLPPERMLFAGMAIGYANADNPVNQLRTPRATFDEIASTMI